MVLFAVIVILGAWLFFEIVEDLVLEDPFSAPDRWMYAALQARRAPVFDGFMVALTELGDAAVVIAVSLAAGGWLIHKRAWRALGFGAAAVGGGSLINTAIKLAMHRARPSDLHYAGASLFSFPSGHSTTNAALYGMVIILVSREMPMRMRFPVAAGLVLFVGAIAFSRVYLGAHWLSDTGGGLIFASVWLAALGIAYMWHPAETIGARSLLIVVAIAVLLAGGTNIALRHSADMRTYRAPPLQVPSL